MIAEVVVRKNGGDSFQRLAAYVLNEKDQGRGDPVGWKLAAYVLDRGGLGEKVAYHRITNCDAPEPGWAVKECLALAAVNKRATKDKSYHLVVSFPESERPSEELMRDIEDTLVNAAGFEGHKRISAVHQNTENWHLHVAIVTVHPETLRNVTPYYDRYRLQEACQLLEVKHDLTRIRHSPSPERALNGKAAALEAHAGRLSFSRWVMENAAVPLTAAVKAVNSWGELHAALANYGLEIKPRGAGLIVASQTDQRGRMKASSIDTSLSFKALFDQLGPYEPATATPEKKATMFYTGAPRGAQPGLWERYQAQRAAAIAARTTAIHALRVAHMRYFNELNAWYAKRYAAAKAAHLNRGDRISTRRTLDSSRNADHARRKAREAEERRALKDAHKIPTWAGFLMQEGGRGDQAAIRALERAAEAQVRSAAIEPAAPDGRDGGRC